MNVNECRLAAGEILAVFVLATLSSRRTKLPAFLFVATVSEKLFLFRGVSIMWVRTMKWWHRGSVTDNRETKVNLTFAKTFGTNQLYANTENSKWYRVTTPPRGFVVSKLEAKYCLNSRQTDKIKKQGNAEILSRQVTSLKEKANEASILKLEI